MAEKRKLKPGFVWHNAKGEQEPNTTEVDANDPAIKGQEQKLEAAEAAPKAESKSEDEEKTEETRPRRRDRGGGDRGVALTLRVVG